MPLLKGGFLYDGDVYILNNPIVSNPQSFWLYMQKFMPEQINYILFHGMHRLWGYDPLGYHLVNLAIHFLNTILIIRILQRFSIKQSFLWGCVFALSPLSVYTAGWIFQMRGNLSVFFCLLSFLLFLHSEAKRRIYLLSILCFYLSQHTKGTALLFPVMLAGFVFVTQNKKGLVKTLPYFAISFAFGLLSVFAMQEQVDIIENFQGAGSPLQRLMLVGQSFWLYTLKVILPFKLKFLYPKTNLDLYNWLNWLPLLALSALLFTPLVIKRKRIRNSTFLILGSYLLALLPILGFFDIGHMQYTFVANHWAYFAFSISIIGFALTFDHFRVKTLPVLIPLVLLFSFFSYQESHRFSSMRNFMLAAIDDNPKSYLGHYNLAVDSIRSGSFSQAVAPLNRALEIYPQHPKVNLALQKLGRGLLENKKFQQAIVAYDLLHSREGATWQSWTELGIAFAMSKDLQQSLKCLKKAAELSPNNEQVLRNLRSTELAIESQRKD